MKRRTLFISIITIILSFLGILRELNLLLDNYGIFYANYILYKFAPEIELRFFLNLFTVEFKSITINFGDLLVFVLLFIGSIIYLTSKGKKKNLLMFALSILLMLFLFVIIPIPSFTIHRSYAMTNYMSIIFKSITWFVIISITIKLLLINRDNDELVFRDNNSINLASNYYRLVHFFFDTVIIILIFHQYCIIEFENLSLIFYSLLYYLFYESLFRRTPMKFLTGTIVESKDGSKVGFKRIFVRTIIRFIPIEPLSFIFSKEGWHDRWSNTTVIKK